MELVVFNLSLPSSCVFNGKYRNSCCSMVVILKVFIKKKKKKKKKRRERKEISKKIGGGSKVCIDQKKIYVLYLFISGTDIKIDCNWNKYFVFGYCY
jgi:hypothetical protein